MKFKDFQLFFGDALSQLIFLDIFLTQNTTKKKNCHQTCKKVFFPSFWWKFVFFSCQTALSQKNIQKNKLGQSISKKQLKIFKFQEKIPAFSARWSVLITVFQVFDSISFFKLSNSILSQKNIQKNKTGEKLRRLYM
jgi:hypothetical protein